MKRIALLPLAALTLIAGCSDETRLPSGLNQGPTPSPELNISGSGVGDEYDGRPVHGAIFTTTPDGGVVNANVQYTRKIEVYLDGGPRNANAAAAGLNDGLYVFQITDPAGKVLLSQDPSKCRVVQLDGGVIRQIVRPEDLPSEYGSHTSALGNGAHAARCHVEDSPDGAAGTSARHDWNNDTELGGGIVVQMMPFLDTPNPGGVYKAWITPLKVYFAKLGGAAAGSAKLDETPAPATAQKGGKPGTAVAIGNAPDAGFASPARNNVKTDNFKVIENPPFIEVVKLDTKTGQLVRGWPILVIDPVEGGEGGGNYTTPTGSIGIPLNAAVKVCEEAQSGWAFDYAQVGGGAQQTNVSPETIDGKTYYCVSVTASSAGTIVIAFGNHEVDPNARISIAPSNGINEVEDEHTFTATVQVDPDETGWVAAPAGTEIAFTTTGSGTFIPANGTCLTVGTTGACTVKLTNANVGVDVVTATVTVLGLTKSTDGVAPNGAPGTKYWVDAHIAIAPDATNGVTESHVFTATFTAVPGTLPAPYSVTYDALAIAITAPAGFVAADYTVSTTCAAPPTASGTVASCTTTINSQKATPAGNPFRANATGRVTFSKSFADGVRSDQLERTTDGAYTSAANAYRNSGPASKIYVAGSLSWEKIDAATPPRHLLGASFRVRRTLDREGGAVSTPNFVVTDNVAPDEAAGAGYFKVSGLPLGSYCIKETAAPAGYLLDPTEQCGIVLTLAAPDNSAEPFVNSLEGRMTGGSGKVYLVDFDQYLTAGFTIHCDITLSNNIEVNWKGADGSAQKWHITKPIKTARCIDDPNVEPGKPNAPFDTFIGTAEGELNNVAGVSRIAFTFVDGGEPGKLDDRVTMRIWDKNGTLVLEIIDQPIRGNLQAHEDQPHR